MADEVKSRMSLRDIVLKLMGDAMRRIMDYQLNDMEIVTSPRLCIYAGKLKVSAVARKSWNEHWCFVVKVKGKQAEGLSFGRQAAIDKCMSSLEAKLGQKLEEFYDL